MARKKEEFSIMDVVAKNLMGKVSDHKSKVEDKIVDIFSKSSIVKKEDDMKKKEPADNDFNMIPEDEEDYKNYFIVNPDLTKEEARRRIKKTNESMTKMLNDMGLND
jgi:hypothetical protein